MTQAIAHTHSHWLTHCSDCWTGATELPVPSHLICSLHASDCSMDASSSCRCTASPAVKALYIGVISQEVTLQEKQHTQHMCADTMINRVCVPTPKCSQGLYISVTSQAVTLQDMQQTQRMCTMICTALMCWRQDAQCIRADIEMRSGRVLIQ